VDGNGKGGAEGGQNGQLDEGEGDHLGIGGYNIEDSPPIGPGGRRSRAR